jgi:hypothetical protein
MTLYERKPDGDLAEVPPELADALAVARGVRLEMGEGGRRRVLLTEADAAERAAAAEAMAAETAAAEAARQARTEAAERARAKLERLGLDADEIAALLDRS